MMKKTLPSQIFMTDDARGTTPRHVNQLPPHTAVIFRDYQHPNRFMLGEAYATACRERGLSFLVAGDPVLARRLHADGLHVPEHRIAAIPSLQEQGWLITAACHSLKAVEDAARFGANAAIVSPVFPTPSHPDSVALGLEGLEAMLAMTTIPLYALGGINAETKDQLPTHSQLAGFAAISYFLNKS